MKSKVQEIGSNVWRCGDVEMEGGCRRCKEWVRDGLEMVRSVKAMRGNG
jgi:hypothetical protein